MDQTEQHCGPHVWHIYTLNQLSKASISAGVSNVPSSGGVCSGVWNNPALVKCGQRLGLGCFCCFSLLPSFSAAQRELPLPQNLCHPVAAWHRQNTSQLKHQAPTCGTVQRSSSAKVSGTQLQYSTGRAPLPSNAAEATSLWARASATHLWHHAEILNALQARSGQWAIGCWTLCLHYLVPTLWICAEVHDGKFPSNCSWIYT